MDQPACRQAGDDDIFYGQTCCVWIFSALVLISFYAAGRGLRPLLTQLATPILTPKIGLSDDSGPDIRWW
jgi:hypothetical protein